MDPEHSLPTEPGAAYLSEDEPERAIHDFDRAISLEPDNSEAHLCGGKALARLERYEPAIHCFYFNQTIELDHEEAEGYYERGTARMELGDYSGAIDDLAQAAKLNPQHPHTGSGRKVAAELLESAKAGKNAGKG